jgi:molecular chaperone GrpE
MSDESNAVDIEIDGDDGDDSATSTEAAADTAEPAEDAVEDVENDSETESSETDLLDRLDALDGEVAADVAERIETLEAERDEALDRVDELEQQLKRTQADFQNYKKRAKKRQESIQERATEDLVERLVPVRDNLQRALDQDEGADIRDGVESTLAELDRVLEEENVEPIEPEPGEEVDPHRHEVLMRVDSDQPPETIAESYRPGYEIGDRVLREAQVTVSDGTAEGDTADGNDDQ